MTYSKSDLESFLSAIPALPALHGRGVIICGGGKYLASAYLAVRSLRHSGCALPVQLWHLGPSEYPQGLAPLFTALGVEAVDAHEVALRYPMRKLGGWQSKPFAITHSPFAEVLFLDADNLVLRDPSPLFDSPEYQRSGSLFWPDFKTVPSDYWAIRPFAWEFLELPPRIDAEIESGQLLINKPHCWRALQATLHMNNHSDFYYERCTYGDKDTFTLGWAVTATERSVVPSRPVFVGAQERIHFDLRGNELFQHCRKWALPVDKNPILPGYRLQKLCFEWLAEFAEVLSLSSIDPAPFTRS